VAKRASSPTGRGGVSKKASKTLPPTFLPRDARGRFVRLLDYQPPKTLPRRLREAVKAAKAKERKRVAELARRVEEERKALRRERERQRRLAQRLPSAPAAPPPPPVRPAAPQAPQPPVPVPSRRLQIRFAEEEDGPAAPPPPPTVPVSPRKIPALPGESEDERKRRIRRERRQRETEFLQEQRQRHAEQRRLEQERVEQARLEREMREELARQEAFEKAEKERFRVKPEETPVTGLPGLPRPMLGPDPTVLPTMTPEEIEMRLSGRIATPEEILEMALRETRDEALHRGMMQPFVPEPVLTRNAKNLSLGQAVMVGQMLNEPDVAENVRAIVQDVAEQIQGVEGSNTPVYVSVRITEIMPLGVHVGSIDRIIAEGSVGTVIESWQGVAAELSGKVRNAEQLGRSAAKLLTDLHRTKPRAMAYIEGVFVRSRGTRREEV